MIIALPKGVVLRRSLDLVAHLLGYRPDPKQLRFSCPGDIDILLVKHRDVPGLLRKNLIDIGVTSTDWLIEKETDISPCFQLDWCFTKIALIAKRNDERRLGRAGHISLCVTEYPNIATKYLLSTGNADRIKVLHVSGSTEAYVGGICDFAIDCVETGETLRRNGLVEVEVLKQISTVVVASKRGERFIQAFGTLLNTFSAVA